MVPGVQEYALPGRAVMTRSIPERRQLTRGRMINLASLLLLSFAEVVFSPLYRNQTSPSAITRTKEIGLWYNVLFSWPVFIVCFWINVSASPLTAMRSFLRAYTAGWSASKLSRQASWGPDISKRASTLLHPTYRHQPSPSLAPYRGSVADGGQNVSGSGGSYAPSSSSDASGLIVTIVKSIRRILLIADFHLVGAFLSYIPLVGYWVSFAYMCIITGSYCFEYVLFPRRRPASGSTGEGDSEMVPGLTVQVDLDQ